MIATTDRLTTACHGTKVHAGGTISYVRCMVDGVTVGTVAVDRRANGSTRMSAHHWSLDTTCVVELTAADQDVDAELAAMVAWMRDEEASA